MTKRPASKRTKALIWVAASAPGALAFMANISSKEAVSNLASWFDLFGLPIPNFLLTDGIDERVTQAVLAFYSLAVTAASLGTLVESDPQLSRRKRANAT